RIQVALDVLLNGAREALVHHVDVGSKAVDWRGRRDLVLRLRDFYDTPAFGGGVRELTRRFDTLAPTCRTRGARDRHPNEGDQHQKDRNTQHLRFLLSSGSFHLRGWPFGATAGHDRTCLRT